MINMRNTMKTQRISLLTFSLFMTGLASAAPYTVTDLGTLGGKYSVAYGINDAGLVVGHSSGPSTTDANGTTTQDFLAHAFLFNGSNLQDLGVLGNNVSYARGINSAGKIAGFSPVNVGTTDAPSYVSRGYIYEAGQLHDIGLPTNLGTPHSSSTLTARAINNNDKIVGGATIGILGTDGTTLTYTAEGFIYDRNTQTFSIIPQFSEEDTGAIEANAINDNNVTVGTASKKLNDSDFASRAFRYDPATNTMLDLGSFNDTASFAYGINNAGKVVGSSYTGDIDIGGSSYLSQAFLYDPTQGSNLIHLGYLSERRRFSNATAINDRDQIVGNSTYSVTVDTSGVLAAVNHAILSQIVSGTRQLLDLNTLLSCEDQSKWILSEANAINNNGQIVGVGSINGEAHAFLLTPPAGEFSGTAPSCETPDSGSSSGGGGGSFGLGLVSLLAAGAAIRRKL